MASGTIAVRDEAMAKAWIAKAQALNERANDLNIRVGNLLKALDDGGVGEIVTTLVNYGTQILSFAEQILNHVSEICKSISTVVDIVKDTVNTVVGTVKGIASALGLG